MRRIPLAIALASLAGACATVGPDFKRPHSPPAGAYVGAGETSPVPLTPGADAPAEWWTAFGSQALNGLVRDAFAHNRTLAEADAQLLAARATAAATQGARAPEASANAGVQRERINLQAFGFPGPSPTITLYSLGTAVSFDLDLFGGRRRAAERDVARAASQQARVDAAYLTISGNVVQQAVLVAGLRAKIAIQEDIIAADQRVFSIVQRAIELGGQPPAAANTVEAQLAEDEAALPPLRQQLASAQHRLALYLGRAPSDLPAFDLELAGLRTPERIPLSVPSELVRRRPDILAAEAVLHATTADIGVHTAALYPNISLNASLTQGALKPADIFRYKSSGWVAGPSISAPVFRGGVLRARVRQADAARQAALAAYEETVLEAFVQVADVLQAIANDQDLIKAQSLAVSAATANARNNQTAYAAGAGTLLALVDAQRQANRARLSAVDAQISLNQNVAALFVASAADWRPAQASTHK